MLNELLLYYSISNNRVLLRSLVASISTIFDQLSKLPFVDRRLSYRLDLILLIPHYRRIHGLESIS